MGMFEIAAAAKLRFNTPMKGGNMTAEDLFDLSLPGLNKIAKSLNKQIKETSEETFIGDKSTVDKELETKFSIVKRVIEIRLAARDAIENAKEVKDFNEQIKRLIHDKENDELKGKSIEELKGLMK